MDSVTEVYSVGDIPVLQNRTYASIEEARNCPRGDIRLVQNNATGLVYNDSFDPELMVYDSSYNNEQAHSQAFKQHLDEVAGIVTRSLGFENLVEIGCGKAYFLELLQSRGFSIKGFDPAYEGANAAIERRYFGEDMTFSADGLVLRHVLEHVPDPVDFLKGIRDANNGGLIYIEVPCLDWILEQKAWFDISYEHVNYFRLSDFSRMFGKVLESGRLFGGQYLYVVADLGTIRVPIAEGSSRVDFPADFLHTVGFSGVSAVWGAGSKGVIYALLRERHGDPVRGLIDINPVKQGGFAPATGLRVMSPQQGMATLAPGSTICVMNPNYLEEIREITQDRFSLIGV